MNEDTKPLPHGESPDLSRDSEEITGELNILELLKDAGEMEKNRSGEKPLELKGPLPSQSPPPPPPIPQPTPAPPPPVSWREYAGLILSVILCDVAIYHGGGFAGYGVLFMLLSLLLFFCSRENRQNLYSLLMVIIIFAVGARLIYLGSGGCVAVGFFLTAALALSLRGYKPFIIETALASIGYFFRSHMNIKDYDRGLRWNRGTRGFHIRTLIAPAAAVMIFGLIFIMANPVLKDFFEKIAKDFWTNVRFLSPKATQVLFWLLILWCTSALLYPRINDYLFKYQEDIEEGRCSPAPGYYYAAARNILTSLILLFAVYFVFEFYYLWWRDIPRDFRYSEYAHEGAAWLTFALALSTALIGGIFRGGFLLDPRVLYVKKLTWIWSLENFLLAICAFHRTQIYVHYNGLSRLRVVAVFGIAVVAAGFVLVILKVAWRKNLLWLVRRHLWALGLTIILYLVTPVDYIVTSYNVNRILSGNPAPTVQIAVHKIGPEGCLKLLPLLECPNENIREGVRALLAKTHHTIERDISRERNKGWTYYQRTKAKALEALRKNRNEWEAYDNPALWSPALQKFEQYGRQWYD